MRSALRFWSKVDRADGCWLWRAFRDRHGYGRYAVTARRPRFAHRYSWELANGPVPAGLCVCHSCDEPACVNPYHLWLGTHADNMADRGRKGRTAVGVGERHGMSKLTEADVRTIRVELACGVLQAVLASRYGVGRTAISAIKTGKLWRHVEVTS
jgi:hypothetical protein